jgi:hypothetical protein
VAAQDRFVRAAVVVLALFWLGSGIWLVAAPHSFYKELATFPPYNRHFLHDAGVFSTALGACLLGALVWGDALSVVLGGVAVGSVLHVGSHLVDSDLGGRSSDPIGLGLIAALAVAGTVVRRRMLRAPGGGAAR